MRRIVAMGLAVLLSACAVDRFDGDGLVPGQATRAEVEKAMGVPADKRAGPGGETVLWYPRLPYGRVSYAARIGKDDKLIAIEQRLTREYLAKLKPGVSREEDVRDVLGPPQKIDWFERGQVNAWSYNAKDIEPQIIVVELSKDGVVRKAYMYTDPQEVMRR
jgi:hypothetical protein